MKTHIFLQARLKSAGLPNKILKKICGKTVFELIIERLKMVKNIDEIILVTDSENLNQSLIEKAKELKINYFCGSDENILDRIYQASKKFSSDTIIRITGDCPLIDFNLINKGLEIFYRLDSDILSVDRKRTYPDGFDFEVFKKEALKISWNDNLKKYKNQEEFYQIFISPAKYMLESNKFKNYDLVDKTNHSNIRLTLDYPEDLEFIKTIYEKLYITNKQFSFKEILHLLENNPELLRINQKHKNLK